MAQQKKPTTKAVAKTMEHETYGSIEKILDQYKPAIEKAIPNNITAERLLQIVLTTLTRNPAIRKCSYGSIIGAVLNSAILGLDPTPQLGHCAFIPRWNSKAKAFECAFEIMYGGYVQLTRNSGELEMVFANVIHENDDWEYTDVSDDMRPKLYHKRKMVDRGEPVATYAIWHFKGGGYHIEFMTIDEVWKHKAVSQSRDSQYSPWNTWQEDMIKKTPIKKSKKMIPMSLGLSKAMATDNNVMDVSDFNAGELMLEQTEGERFEEETQTDVIESTVVELEEKSGKMTRQQCEDIAVQMGAKNWNSVMKELKYPLEEYAKDGITDYEAILDEIAPLHECTNWRSRFADKKTE